jgi:hypothetical protein
VGDEENNEEEGKEECIIVVGKDDISLWDMRFRKHFGAYSGVLCQG